MAKLVLKRPVAYQVIVTEQFKKEMTAEFQAAADQVQAQVDELEFRTKRYLLELQRTNLSQAMAARDQVENEKKRQQRVKEEILRKKEEVSQLPEGTKYLRGNLEGVVEASVGDNIKSLLSRAEIVVKDDVIIEINDGRERE